MKLSKSQYGIRYRETAASATISGYTSRFANHSVAFLPRAYAPVITPTQIVASSQRSTCGPPIWFTMKLSIVFVTETP